MDCIKKGSDLLNALESLEWARAATLARELSRALDAKLASERHAIMTPPGIPKIKF